MEKYEEVLRHPTFTFDVQGTPWCSQKKAPLRHSPRTTVQPRLPHVPMPGVGKDAYEEEFEHFADRRSAREAATKAPNRDRATESASSSAIMGNASADGP